MGSVRGGGDRYHSFQCTPSCLFLPTAAAEGAGGSDVGGEGQGGRGAGSAAGQESKEG